MASQGANANYSGQKLELQVEQILAGFGLSFHSQTKFTDIYNNPRAKMDFYVEDLDLAIECKRQQGAGTADQKMPFVVKNLERHPAKYGLLVLDGEHFKARTGIQEYLQSEVSEYFDYVFVEDLEDWLLEQTNKRAAT